MLKNKVGYIDIANIPYCKVLKRIIQEFMFIIEKFSLSIQNMLVLPSTLKYNGMRSVIGIFLHIKSPD